MRTILLVALTSSLVACTSSAPDDPVPVDPKPVDPKPVDPKPQDPATPDPAPSDPNETSVPPELAKELNELAKAGTKVDASVETMERTFSAAGLKRQAFNLANLAQVALKEEPEALAALEKRLQEARKDPIAKIKIAREVLRDKDAMPPPSSETNPITNFARKGDLVEGELVASSDDGKLTIRTVAEFVREGGQWKLDDIRLGKMKLKAPETGEIQPTDPKATEPPPVQDLAAGDFDAALEQAQKFAQRRDYKAAEEVWSKFIVTAPSHARANYELGRVLFLSGDLPQAEKQCKMACMLGHDDGCVQAKLIAEQRSRVPK